MSQCIQISILTSQNNIVRVHLAPLPYQYTECKSKMSTLFSRFASAQFLRGSNQRLLSTTKVLYFVYLEAQGFKVYN